MRRQTGVAKAGCWITVMCLFGFARDVLSCSTFVLRQGNHIVFGRNYDYPIGCGLVFVNKAGLRKTPLQLHPSSLAWDARFGGVSFNQYGREAPMDGMNQAGLVVAQMALDGTSYPTPDSRPPLGILSWVQYQLDNCATAEDVIRTDSAIRISPESQPVHYLVADQAGGVAVIEFLAGRMTVHRGDALPVPVLTNSRYDDSLANLQQYVGFGGTTPIPTSSGSLSRFVRAADLVSRYGPQESRPIIDYAFAILSSVAQSSTQWTIVYDLTDRKVYFRTRQSPEIRHFRTDGLDLLCRTAPNILDVNVTAAGDVYELFQPYTRAANRDLIYTAYRGTDWLSNTPDAVIDALAALPESFPCCRPKPWTDKTRILPPLQSRKKQ